ncbi:MAG: hypothetical protein IT534_06235 [Bauldia sp.]|jgi:hypothetical protein|nr:hypothetical protein [Bauldia sp.]
MTNARAAAAIVAACGLLAACDPTLTWPGAPVAPAGGTAAAAPSPVTALGGATTGCLDGTRVMFEPNLTASSLTFFLVPATGGNYRITAVGGPRVFEGTSGGVRVILEFATDYSTFDTTYYVGGSGPSYADGCY